MHKLYITVRFVAIVALIGLFSAVAYQTVTERMEIYENQRGTYY